ncbi:MAG: prepilin peptidase [Fidelibacterota bacterium]
MTEFFVILFGLTIGSFLNVVIYRLPLEKSIVKPRSACPHCGYVLKAWENIPVLSYLFLRGKCSSCKNTISSRYALVELLTALMFYLTYREVGLTADLFAYAIFISIVIAITFIDVDHQIIPNNLLLVGIIPGLWPWARSGFMDSSYIIGALSLGLGFYAIAVLGQLAFRKEAMGMGDVKYAALMGLILGWQGGLIAIALAFFSAAMIILGLMVIGKASVGQRIPFGPYLSLGCIIALFWSRPIIDWYLTLILV